VAVLHICECVLHGRDLPLRNLGSLFLLHLRHMRTRVRDIPAKRLRELLAVIGEDLRILRPAWLY